MQLRRSYVRRKLALGCALSAALCLGAFNVRAQDSLAPPQPDMTIDAATRTQVIEGALKELAAAYVYPDVAREMDKAIRTRIANKEYEQITSATALAKQLTTDLQAVSRDKHLRVAYRAEALAAGDGPPGPVRIVRRTDAGDEHKEMSPVGGRRVIVRTDAGDAKGEAAAPPQRIRLLPPDPSGKQGLEKVERLPGDLGYLQFSYFAGADAVGEKVSAAMNELHDTNALIIDLRHSRGGSADTIEFLMSYLFSGRVHLNDMYNRLDDTTMEAWTFDVPGKHYLDKDVYLLTDSGTFSAAEAISYTLQNLKRATIIGATTGGGAHPVMPRRLTDHFLVTVPFARYISTVTKSNWEGVGVKPDIAVPPAQALAVAQLTALKRLTAKTTDSAKAAELKARIATLEKELAALQSAATPAKS